MQHSHYVAYDQENIIPVREEMATNPNIGNFRRLESSC